MFRPDGEVNDKLPKKISQSLGPTAEDIIIINEEAISKRQEELKDLETRREAVSENQRETVDHQIEERNEEIERLERENEAIEERMSP